ncbi:hypothetical protein F9K88_22410 [Brucella intermedia]|uniref:hypothetical protein n=1 Tax=Brucella TaxID=234 RepID=UPI0007C3FC61|nr:MULTISPECIES: hypothetical protein [Brucella/Ochrobactrum group]PJT18389.1 hypothetical protein CN884_23645 [Ochrobactrum sp. 30A/1000/2015]PJT36360.1 hypothetical protein CN883_23655 [Ochrobactrum sp. 27A/999/2015]PJT40972.1 hypothetical protein CN882_23475 [Ochrobactrum sp. 23A/997/2015]KAB2705255.1 hypothetical protein F9K88_22410 [Brucella intermedia]MBA8845227.1 hypothetical protein [Ochrobactrum sp. RH1CCR137]
MWKIGSTIYPQIHNAVRVKGILAEPFTPRDVRRVAPGWPYSRYFSFLAENCTANQPEGDALFVRVGRGQYHLNDKVSGSQVEPGHWGMIRTE